MRTPPTCRSRRDKGRRIREIDIVDSGSTPDVIPFIVYSVADVSTGYIEASDCALLEQPDCPTRFAITDDGAGTFHWVAEDEKTFEEEMGSAEQFGLSERFRLIMTRLHQANIPYVRFDADGGDVSDLDRKDPQASAPER